MRLAPIASSSRGLAEMWLRQVSDLRQLASIITRVWAFPNTLIGLLFAPVALLGGGTVRRVSGVIEMQGRAIAWLLKHIVPLRGGASALTLGHVVLARDEDCLRVTRTHERVHVQQYERWGPLFLPAYAIASLLALVRGGDAYLDNHFECEARGRQSERPQAHTKAGRMDDWTNPT